MENDSRTHSGIFSSSQPGGLYGVLFLLFQACVCIGLGLTIFFSPAWFTQLSSIEASLLHGVTDIRATYGGLFTVVGAAALFAVIVSQWRMQVLGTIMLVYAGLGFARVAAALLSSDFSAYTWLCAGFELISFLIAVVLLRAGANKVD